MTDCTRIMADIDGWINHIKTQVDMGANVDEVVTEQYKALLQEFSQLPNVDVGMSNRISKHLLRYSDLFSHLQLQSFSASLRAALSAVPAKGNSRCMQSNEALEHSLLQSDWDHLQELGQQENQTSEPFEQRLAIRMHRLGISCADVGTLKKASAIIQAVWPGARTSQTASRSYHRSVRAKLKALDKASPWPFHHIRTYPRSPWELPPEVLLHAYGDDRPVTMPLSIDPDRFKLLLADTRYNKPRPEKTRPEQAPQLDIVPHQGVSQPPTPHMHDMLAAGPFAQMVKQFCTVMHGMQNAGTPQSFFHGSHPASPCNLETSNLL